MALIHGACLGGGLELALACNYRIVSDHPKTQLGLPEVTLGIFPGWGGTQRLPRLIGLTEALPLLLSGKTVNARKAWKIKLADGIAAPEFLQDKGHAFIAFCLTREGRQKIADRQKPQGLKYALLEANPLGRSLIYYKAKKEVERKSKGHYPAPMILLKLVKETYPLPLDQGLKKEAECFKSSMKEGFSIAPHLIHLFFVQEALKKENVFFGKEAKPLPVQSAGIIGAGTMGSGIAWLFSNKEMPVRMKDIDWQAIGKGFESIHSIYAKMAKEKRLTPSEASLKFHHVSGSVDYSRLQPIHICDRSCRREFGVKTPSFKGAGEPHSAKRNHCHKYLLAAFGRYGSRHDQS